MLFNLTMKASFAFAGCLLTLTTIYLVKNSLHNASLMTKRCYEGAHELISDIYGEFGLEVIEYTDDFLAKFPDHYLARSNQDLAKAIVTKVSNNLKKLQEFRKYISARISLNDMSTGNINEFNAMTRVITEFYERGSNSELRQFFISYHRYQWFVSILKNHDSSFQSFPRKVYIESVLQKKDVLIDLVEEFYSARSEELESILKIDFSDDTKTIENYHLLQEFINRIPLILINLELKKARRSVLSCAESGSLQQYFGLRKSFNILLIQFIKESNDI